MTTDKYSQYTEAMHAYADAATAMQAERHAQEIAAYELTVSNLREQLEARGVPVAWIRYCSDGSYEGPIMDSRMEDVRKKSGVWTPLYAAPQPAAQPEPMPTSVSRSKRAQLESEGYVVNGVTLINPETRQRVLLDYCGFVGWWHGQVHHDQQAQQEPAQAVRKPMTDDEIYQLYSEPSSDAEMVAFARAVEAFHGIVDNEDKKVGT